MPPSSLRPLALRIACVDPAAHAVKPNPAGWDTFLDLVPDIATFTARGPITRGHLCAVAYPQSAREFVLFTLMWGYPHATMGRKGRSNMRTILGGLPALTAHAEELLAAPDQRWSWAALAPRVRYSLQKKAESSKLKGVGIATYSKLLALGGGTIYGYPALIYDRHLARTWYRGEFMELEGRAWQRTDGPQNGKYTSFLSAMVKTADLLNQYLQEDEKEGTRRVSPEQLELFLFKFSQVRQRAATAQEAAEQALARLPTLQSGGC